MTPVQSVSLEDLARPRFTPEAQQILDAMASMAPACPLDADALHAQACADTGLQDFGPDDYRERLDTYLVALREIEFDRATGKLSDVDYADLKTRYTREAIDAMRREDSQKGVVVGAFDAAEQSL